MRTTNNELDCSRPKETCSPILVIAVLALSIAAADAQESQVQKDDQALRNCVTNLGWAGCTGGPQRPIPETVNDLWNAIAYSPSHNIAAFAGSFTAPENAKAAALKGCAEWARDCRIVVAAHDVCVAVGYERAAGGPYRWATAATKQDAQGKALSAECKAAGPQRCRVLAGCTGTPPHLLVSK
jgi:hypothetical protein